MEKATRSRRWMRRRTIGCGCRPRGTQVAEVVAPTKKGGRAAPCASPCGTLGRVVHLELDRMRGHAEARDLLHLERDVRVDNIVGEHPAAREELAVAVQGIERLVERSARMRHLRGFLGL